MNALMRPSPEQRLTALQAAGLITVLFLVVAMPTFLGLMPAETLAQAECTMNAGDGAAAVLAAMGGAPCLSERVVAPPVLDALTAARLPQADVVSTLPCLTTVRAQASGAATSVARLL